MESVADNIRASVSQAKNLSAKVAYKIIDRIALLNDPEKAQKEILKNKTSSNIAINYAEN